MLKYLAILFFIAAGLSAWWGFKVDWADGSSWVTGIAAAIGVIILGISYRNTGKVFTDEAGNH